MADPFWDIDRYLEKELRRWMRLTRRLQERFRRMYEDLAGELPAFRYEIPLYDLIDKGDRYVLEIELPGVDKKDIEIYVKDHLLHISAKRKIEYGEEKEGYIRKERSYIGFKRVIELPEDADVDKIKAVYKDGILRIEIPKRPEGLGKRVNVEG